MSREGNNRPVDGFVRGIRYVLDDFQEICADYRGQERHCCDSVKSCYKNVDQTLINVRLQGALKQNMHQACRRIDAELQTVNNCVDTKLGMCYKVNTRDLENDFEDFKQRFKEEFDKHCNNLPPERNTSKPESTPALTKETTTAQIKTLPKNTTETTKTTNVLTTSAAVTQTTTYDTTEEPNTSRSTTKEPTTVSTKLDNAFTVSTLNPKNVSMSIDKTAYPNIIVTDGAVTTVTTEGPAHSTAFKTSKAINNVTDPTQTEPKPRPVQTTDSILSTSAYDTTTQARVSPDPSLQHPPSDNTAIIVSAVCCGILVILAVLVFIVFRIRKKRFLENCDGCFCTKGLPCKLFQRDKPPAGPQEEIYTEIDDKFMQAVYEFDKKKDPHPNLKNRVQTNAHVNVCYSSADDGLIPSTKSRGPTLQLGTRNLRQIPKQNTYQTSNQMRGSLEKSTKKDFVFSHSTFTDPRGTEAVPDEYVQISEKYECIEPVYDQPQHHNNTILSDLKTNDVTDRNEYDHIVKHQTEEVYSEPDYINSGVTQNNDHLYENEKIGNYEIKQSRF